MNTTKVLGLIVKKAEIDPNADSNVAIKFEVCFRVHENHVITLVEKSDPILINDYTTIKDCKENTFYYFSYNSKDDINEICEFKLRPLPEFVYTNIALVLNVKTTTPKDIELYQNFKYFFIQDEEDIIGAFLMSKMGWSKIKNCINKHEYTSFKEAETCSNMDIRYVYEFPIDNLPHMNSHLILNYSTNRLIEVYNPDIRIISSNKKILKYASMLMAGQPVQQLYDFSLPEFLKKKTKEAGNLLLTALKCVVTNQTLCRMDLKNQYLPIGDKLGFTLGFAALNIIMQFMCTLDYGLKLASYLDKIVSQYRKSIFQYRTFNTKTLIKLLVLWAEQMNYAFAKLMKEVYEKAPQSDRARLVNKSCEDLQNSLVETLAKIKSIKNSVQSTEQDLEYDITPRDVLFAIKDKIGFPDDIDMMLDIMIQIELIVKDPQQINEMIAKAQEEAKQHRQNIMPLQESMTSSEAETLALSPPQDVPALEDNRASEKLTQLQLDIEQAEKTLQYTNDKNAEISTELATNTQENNELVETLTKNRAENNTLTETITQNKGVNEDLALEISLKQEEKEKQEKLTLDALLECEKAENTIAKIKQEQVDLTKSIEAMIKGEYSQTLEKFVKKGMELSPFLSAMIGKNSRIIKSTSPKIITSEVSKSLYESGKDNQAIANRIFSYIYDKLTQAKYQIDQKCLASVIISLGQQRMTVLAGNPGSGKTSLGDYLANILQLNPENYAYVSVAHGWHTADDLIGFYNDFTHSFRSANNHVHKLMLQANEVCNSPTKKHKLNLVLLDEANLSRLEYYLHEFLGRWDKSVIQIQEGDKTLSLDYHFKFLATLNIDSTTEILSPRIRDRINVIHLSPSGEPVTPVKIADTLEISAYDLYTSFNHDQDKVSCENLSKLATDLGISQRTTKAMMNFYSIAKGLSYINSDTNKTSLVFKNSQAEDYAFAITYLHTISSDNLELIESLEHMAKKYPYSRALIETMKTKGDSVNYYDLLS